MSTATPDQTPVLLAKFAVTPAVYWYGTENDTVQVAFDEALVGLADAGLIILGETHNSVSSFATLTETGTALAATARATMLTTTATDGGGRANAALWLWLVVNGSEQGSYGDDYPYGRRGQIAHLLLCGLDLDKSGGVKDDSLTVSGRAVCTCGQVQVQIKAQVESITALISQVLASA